MRYHFSGIGGAGMNPLARLMAVRGHRVQGSDRDFDRGRNQAVADLLRGDGIELLPQDGTAITADLDRVIHSAAVEPTVPELVAADRLGIERLPRPALLAEVVATGRPGVAIAGSSGKSTVTGMVAWILRQEATATTVLGGAALAEGGANHMGCFAAAGEDAPVVAEACESDGTLVDYRPGIGLIHNISRDHGELAELRRQFATFADNAGRLLIDAACAETVAVAGRHAGLLRYGVHPQAELRLEVVQPGPWRATGTLHVDGLEHVLELPQPGAHTLRNACAAVAVARELGVAPAAACAALRDFPGVARRFQILGRTDGGSVVIDDYAHNAAKIEAAVSAAQLGSDHLLCVFQPHGFGPAHFLRQELRELWLRLLRSQDRLCYAPIYDAGGTAPRTITNADLAADLPPDLGCGAPSDRAELLVWVAEHARAGGAVLIMGARDPSLPELARAIHDLL